MKQYPFNRLSRAFEMLVENSDYTTKEILGKRRYRELTTERHRIMYELFAAGFGYSEIGRQCNRNHSSVIYAVRRYGYKEVMGV